VPADNPYLVAPGSGRTVLLHDLQIRHTVSGGQTAGAFSIVEHVIAPKVLVKPHRHTREDEVSIVLRGTVSVRVGTLEFQAGPGSYVVKPKDVPHAIWNMGPEPSHVIEIVSPAGFERYFDELEPILREEGPEWTKLFYAVAEKYGIIAEDEWSKEIQKTYGVHL
jgi:mannose-6-phosphate isomerase-like protein (cupin superfamily)